MDVKEIVGNDDIKRKYLVIVDEASKLTLAVKIFSCPAKESRNCAANELLEASSRPVSSPTASIGHRRPEPTPLLCRTGKEQVGPQSEQTRLPPNPSLSLGARKEACTPWARMHMAHKRNGNHMNPTSKHVKPCLTHHPQQTKPNTPVHTVHMCIYMYIYVYIYTHTHVSVYLYVPMCITHESSYQYG